ncbi:hypothetical protein MT418_8610 [Batrachochytrium dendrobatidis]
MCWDIDPGSSECCNINLLNNDMQHSQTVPNGHFILDNIPFHKTTLIRHGLPTIQQTAQCLELHYTASYCPFLNPADNYFGVWNDCVLSHFKHQTTCSFNKANNPFSTTTMNM